MAICLKAITDRNYKLGFRISVKPVILKIHHSPTPLTPKALLVTLDSHFHCLITDAQFFFQQPWKTNHKLSSSGNRITLPGKRLPPFGLNLVHKSKAETEPVSAIYFPVPSAESRVAGKSIAWRLVFAFSQTQLIAP